MVDYYQILEVPRTATTQEIKASYKKLAMKFHPDHNLNNPFAEDYFKRVNEAYRVLGDVNKKYLYDLGLAIPTPAQTSTYQTQSEPYTSPRPHTPYTHDYDYDPKNAVSAITKRNITIATITFAILMVLTGVWFLSYLNDRSAHIRFNEAKALYEEKEPRYALMKLRDALHYDPYFYEAYLLRAKIHMDMLNYSQASEDYEFILKNKKFETTTAKNEILFAKTLCLYKAYFFEIALQDFEMLAKANPQNEKYQFFRAACLIKSDKLTPELCEIAHHAHLKGIAEADEIVRIYCAKPKEDKKQAINKE
jgi:curved DNA-binding protein CbpA